MIFLKREVDLGSQFLAGDFFYLARLKKTDKQK